MNLQEFKKDLTKGEDVRGDHALFIERKHFQKGNALDWETFELTKDSEAVFFRIIENGEQQHSHGWIERGQIIQWG